MRRATWTSLAVFVVMAQSAHAADECTIGTKEQCTEQPEFCGERTCAPEKIFEPLCKNAPGAERCYTVASDNSGSPLCDLYPCCCDTEIGGCCHDFEYLPASIVCEPQEECYHYEGRLGACDPTGTCCDGAERDCYIDGAGNCGVQTCTDGEWYECTPTDECRTRTCDSEGQDLDCCAEEVGPNSVNVVTGEVSESARSRDAEVEAAAHMLSLHRRYSSHRALAEYHAEYSTSPSLPSTWGGGWYHDFEQLVFVNGGGNPVHIRPNGRSEVFLGDDASGYVAAEHPGLRLTRSFGSWVLHQYNGRRLTFVDAAGSPNLARLVEIREPAGQLLKMTYYSAGGPSPCDAHEHPDIDVAGRICTIALHEEADPTAVASVCLTSYAEPPCTAPTSCPDESDCPLRLRELRYGPGDDCDSHVYATRYAYHVRSQLFRDDTVAPGSCSSVLAEARQGTTEGAQFLEPAFETYEYTRDSYNRSDFGDAVSGNPYAISRRIAPSFDSGAAPAASVELLSRIRSQDGVLVQGYEYDRYGRGAASLAPGEMLTIFYTRSMIPGGPRVTTVTNESDGSSTGFVIDNGRVTSTTNTGGCRVGQVGSFEREPDLGNRVTAKVSLDPDDAGPLTPTRTIYAYDTDSNISLEVENCEATDPQDIVVEPPGATPGSVRDSCGDGPYRARRFEYEPGIVAIPKVESKVFSAVCSEAASFELTCPTNSEPLLRRTFSGSAVIEVVEEGRTLVRGSLPELIETSRTVRYSRNSDGRLLATTDELGYVTERLYYADGDADPCGSSDFNAERLAAIRLYHENDPDPEGVAIVLERHGGYDGLGKPGCIVDANAVITRYSYDGLGRTTSVTLETPTGDSRTTAFTYDSTGRMTSVAQGAFLTETTHGTDDGACDGSPIDVDGCLDALGIVGRPLVETMTAGGEVILARRSRYGHGGDAWLIATEDGMSVRRAVGMAHDGAGRLLDRYKLIDQVPPTQEALTSPGAYPSSHHTYDNLGRRVATRDEHRDFDNRRMTYDALGRLVSVSVWSDATTMVAKTSYGYDAHGNMISVIDPDGRETRYLYDDFGQLIAVDSPDSGLTRFAYDLAGNLIWKQTADGVETVYTYDNRRRLAEVFFAYAGPGDTPDRIYHYDGDVQPAQSEACGHGLIEFEQRYTAGRLAGVEHEAGTTYYSYSAFGEVEAEFRSPSSDAGFDICALRITRTNYDSSGRVTSMTYPSGRVLTFGYEAGDLYPSSVAISGDGWGPVTLASNVEYDVDGQPRGFAGPVAFDADWDLSGQQLTRAYQGAPGEMFEWVISSRDEAGNVLAAGDAAKLKELNLTYDAQDRVDTVAGHVLRGYQDCSYAYDRAGNRTGESCYSRPVTYEYSAGNNELTALTWEPGALCGPGVTEIRRDIQRDVLGRARVSYPGRFSWADDAVYLTYGDNGRLETADVAGDVFTYSYDHMSLRQTVTGPTGTTAFTYGPNGLLLSEERNGDVKEYVWLNDMMLAVLVTPAGGDTSPSAMYSMGVDNLGTPQRAWDSSTGAFSWAADYEAFGKAWTYKSESTAAPDVEINLRFPGQYFDAETGLHYNWHRYMDPNTGRYLTPEPALSDPYVARLVATMGLNGYSYGLSAPLRYVDPNGYLPVGGGGFGSLGGAAAPTLAPAPGPGGLAGLVFFGALVCAATDICDLGPEPPGSPSSGDRYPGYHGAPSPDDDDEPCPDEDDGDDCDELYANDVSQCRQISKIRGKAAGRRCYASAAERYAACIAGRSIPPFDVWNN